MKFINNDQPELGRITGGFDTRGPRGLKTGLEWPTTTPRFAIGH
jgi:hypothetical protein